MPVSRTGYTGGSPVIDTLNARTGLASRRGPAALGPVPPRLSRRVRQVTCRLDQIWTPVVDLVWSGAGVEFG